MKKLMQNNIKSKIYEKTDFLNKQLSSWNVRAVLINKIENSTSENELRMIYDYSKMMKKLSDVHVKLMFEDHDYLFDFKHECYMIANLKHDYFTIEIYSKNRKFFAFIISRLDQLQFTWMQQSFMTAFFIMFKLIYCALKKIFEELNGFEKKSFFFKVFFQIYWRLWFIIRTIF